MLRFPETCKSKRAFSMPTLVCLVIIFAGAVLNPNAASAKSIISNKLLIAQDPCTGGNCIYLPAVVSPETAAFAGEPATRNHAVTLYQSMYRTSATSAANWTGDYDPCIPGSTAAAFRDAVLLRVNYFRRMAGVPDLEGLSAIQNDEGQQAALMMSRNRALNHTPPSSWACYTQAGGAAAGKSNLAMGVNGPAAIDLYMNDYGLAALGHRRWLLYPQTRWAATGDIPAGEGYPAANAFRVFDDNLWGPRPETRDGFVAWPPPAYVPYPVVYAYWSFAYPNADFSRASVSVSSGGASVAVKQYAQQNGYGEAALVWSIEGIGQNWPRPSADTAYQVAVRGVLIDGAARDFTYTVTVFDPD